MEDERKPRQTVLASLVATRGNEDLADAVRRRFATATGRGCSSFCAIPLAILGVSGLGDELRELDLLAL